MQQTSGSNKQRKMILLMGLSMVLLAAFLGYWLTAQYNSSKLALRKDLEHIFVRSVNDVTDSFLLGAVINPILKKEEDKLVRFRVHTFGEKVRDTFIGEKDIERWQTDIAIKSGQLKQNYVKTIQIRQRNTDSANAVMDSIALSGLKKMRRGKILIHADGDSSKAIEDSIVFVNMEQISRGLKMLINEMSNSSAQFIPIDTSGVRTDFVKNLKKEGMLFKAEWLRVGKGREGIVISETYSGTKLSMLVKGYKGHLFKVILPEILFALLLLSVIATAFISMYRSFRFQQRLSTMKDDLVSNMTHELRTPIATVKVALEALDSFRVINDPRKSQEYVKMAISEMDRLELLVNQALNTSLLEKGTIAIQPQPHDLLALVNQTIIAMQIRLDQAEAKLSVIAHGEDFNAFVDKLHLQGLLINLLDNSIKYADKPLVLSIIIEAKLGHIVITVKDNGPGITGRYLDKVFDRFFRVPAGNVHNIAGYGLGLSYAKQVADQHGGTISVSNNSDDGCSFSLTLPRTTS